jgi:O-antigen ligase
VFLVVLLFPFAQEQLVFFGIPLYFHEAAILLGLIAFFSSREKMTSLPMAVIFGATLLVFGVVLSLLANGATKTALGILKSWFIFPILLAFLLSQLFRTKKDIRKLLMVWFAVAVSVAALAITSPFLTGWTYDGRLRYFFPSPNHLAMFLSPGILLGWYLLADMRYGTMNKKSAAAIISGAALLMVSVFLTKSASTFIAVFAGSGIFVAFTVLPFARAWRITVIPAVFVFLLSVGYPSGETRNSLASRVMIWNASEEMIVGSPIIGIGPGNFQEAYLNYQQRFPRYLEWAVPHPHNILLTVWLYSGIFGLFGFLMVSGFAMREAVRSLKRNQPVLGKLLPALALSFFVSIFIDGLADTPYFKNEFAMFFWIFVALSLTFHRSGNDLTRIDEPKKKADHLVG